MNKLPELTQEQSARVGAILRDIATNPKNLAYARVKQIVNAWATLTTPQGRVINEPSVTLGNVTCSVEGRARKGNISIVRVDGVTVLHQWDATYVPGEWEQVIERAAAAIDAEAKARAEREATAAQADGTLTIRRAA